MVAKDEEGTGESVVGSIAPYSTTKSDCVFVRALLTACYPNSPEVGTRMSSED